MFFKGAFSVLREVLECVINLNLQTVELWSLWDREELISLAKWWEYLVIFIEKSTDNQSDMFSNGWYEIRLH